MQAVNQQRYSNGITGSQIVKDLSDYPRANNDFYVMSKLRNLDSINSSLNPQPAHRSSIGSMNSQQKGDRFSKTSEINKRPLVIKRGLKSAGG